MPPMRYVELLKSEIRHRRASVPFSKIDTIYFGGGTPSLLPAEYILAVIEELANVGFTISEEAEVTIEINPATINESKLDIYQKAGINRFSVGAQTFDDDLLKLCGREHNSSDTRNTLKLLKSRDLNYSFDILFALPSQRLSQLERDLEEVLEFNPPHVSAYCLTVPEGHPMALNRPKDEVQVEMFSLIEKNLMKIGLLKYEISNFARPGFESKHNLLYWQDQSYWGLGLSAHSYFNDVGFGIRFWNPKSLEVYEDQALTVVGPGSFHQILPVQNWEVLQQHEALTDFCHTSLRTSNGLDSEALRRKFGGVSSVVFQRLSQLEDNGLVISTPCGWMLTEKGHLLSNRVFAETTFLKEELLEVQGPGH